MNPEPASRTDEALVGLNRLFDQALRALGDAGRTDAACELAAQGWSLVRHASPREGERLNGTLHYLTRAPKRPASGNEAAQDAILDVREFTPARRHELIFETWFALEPGTAFVLVNDHDPKPLYDQFAAERSGAFSWVPQEDGPVVWKVRIGRTDAAG